MSTTNDFQRLCALLQLYQNKLSGTLPAVAPNCPLCSPHQNTTNGFGSALTVQPMRPGYGAPHAALVAWLGLPGREGAHRDAGLRVRSCIPSYYVHFS